MLGNSLKYTFALLVLGLLGFIAFTMYQDKYLNTDEQPIEVVEKRIHEKPILERIEAIGKIELVKYQIKDAIEYTKKRKDILLPDAKILVVISGEAVGCIDFTKIHKEDIQTLGDSLIITMPEPELCYYKIDHQNTKIIDITAHIGQLFDRDKTAITDAALKKAEKSVERMALASNILEQTKQNAETMLKPLLKSLTDKEIILHYREIDDDSTIRELD
ncbi:MAG: DUF4230 domain-containing protein [Flammeovirgaceae bacterium]